MSGFLSPVLQMLQCLISVFYARTPYHCVCFSSSVLHPYLEHPGTGGASPASPGSVRTFGVMIFLTINH